MIIEAVIVACGLVVAHAIHATIIRNRWSKDKIRFEFQQARELEAWKLDNREPFPWPLSEQKPTKAGGES